METKKLSTIQKRDKLNTINRVGEPGPGGAYHDYEIYFNCNPGEDDNHRFGVTIIAFQKGHRTNPISRHGVLEADLLEIVRDRLQCFQKGEYSTRENAIALTHIEEALLWMNKRVEDRIERDVLGTYEK